MHALWWWTLHVIYFSHFQSIESSKLEKIHKHNQDELKEKQTKVQEITEEKSRKAEEDLKKKLTKAEENKKVLDQMEEQRIEAAVGVSTDRR